MATREEVIFLIKLCEICHRKAYSNSKGPQKPIISIVIFQPVQIDLIDMRSTLDITSSGTFLWIAHLVNHMSKQRMLAAMESKEAITVSRVVHRWICIDGVMDILQSKNGSELKMGIPCSSSKLWCACYQWAATNSTYSRPGWAIKWHCRNTDQCLETYTWIHSLVRVPWCKFLFLNLLFMIELFIADSSSDKFNLSSCY